MLARRHEYQVAEGTYHRQFDHEMREQNLLRAFPLLLRRRDLVGLQLPLPEERDRVHDDPGDAAPKVHNLKWSSWHTSTSAPRKRGRTSCSRKLARPVARMGFPSHRYQFTHWVSNQLSEDMSVFA